MTGADAKAWRTGYLGLAAVVCLLALMRGAAAGEAQGPPGLASAEHSYRLNLALGESLAGKAASAGQLAEAQRHIEQGLQAARSAPKEERDSAAGHRIIGLLLCAAYRPVKTKATPTDKRAPQASRTVLKRGNAEEAQRNEGLAELRMALRAEPQNMEHQLDYAEAMQICGKAEVSTQQLEGLWGKRRRMTPEQQGRAARLLVAAARSQKQTAGEARWLRELLAADPQDQEAARRLTAITPKPTGIAWLAYEEGMAMARQQKKPVMIDFTTSWCGWCKKLEAEVFPKPEVLKLSRQFVCIRVDGDARKDVVRRYGVDGYPTIVFLNHYGQSLHRIVGYRDAGPFVAAMEQALAQ